MKNIIRCLSIAIPVSLLVMSGCKKAEIASTGSYQDAVYFVHNQYDENIDSTNFSFIALSDSIKVDTLWLPVRIAGNVSASDRTITLEAVDSVSTAIAGTHYKLLTYVMPKDSFTTNLGVLLYRTPDLQNKVVTLTLRIVPDKDFPVLMHDTLASDGSMYSNSTYRINFTDELIEPSDWPTFLVYLFGAYSKTKYRFIIDVTGQTQFPISGAGALSYSQLLYYQGICETALASYNAANGPLYDENGNPVTFP